MTHTNTVETTMTSQLNNYLQRIEDLRGQVSELIADLPAQALNWRPIEDDATNSLAVLAAHSAGAEHFWIGERWLVAVLPPGTVTPNSPPRPAMPLSLSASWKTLGRRRERCCLPCARPTWMAGGRRGAGRSVSAGVFCTSLTIPLSTWATCSSLISCGWEGTANRRPSGSSDCLRELQVES